MGLESCKSWPQSGREKWKEGTEKAMPSTMEVSKQLCGRRRGTSEKAQIARESVRLDIWLVYDISINRERRKERKREREKGGEWRKGRRE